jgi:hypothetical protein
VNTPNTAHTSRETALEQLRNDQYAIEGDQLEYRKGWNAGVRHAIRIIERAHDWPGPAELNS